MQSERREEGGYSPRPLTIQERSRLARGDYTPNYADGGNARVHISLPKPFTFEIPLPKLVFRRLDP